MKKKSGISFLDGEKNFLIIIPLILCLLCSCGNGKSEEIVSVPEEEPVLTVCIGNMEYDQETTKIDLSNTDCTAEEILNAISGLPLLEELDLGCISFSVEELNDIRKACPAVELTYSVSILGREYGCSETAVDLTDIDAGSLDNVISALRLLPDLTDISVTPENGNNALGFEELGRLQEAAPQAAFDYRFEMFGKEISTADTEIEYVNVEMKNEGAAEWKSVLPYMTNLKRLCLDTCGIDNEVMADLRDSFPEISIVWRVFWNRTGSLTDTHSIRMTGGLTDCWVEDSLKYCTEVRFLDFGHNFNLSNIDYLAYMPHLKLCTLSDMPITDLSPISNCKELIMLEIVDCTKIKDISPLAECTNLRLLNFSNAQSITDISPLYGLKNLERLYSYENQIPEEQMEEIKQLLPDCWITFERPAPSEDGVSTWYSVGWRLDSGYPDVKAEWYNELLKIFGIGEEYYPTYGGWYSYCEIPYECPEDELVYFAD